MYEGLAVKGNTMKEFYKDKLRVLVASDREAMGNAAAAEIRAEILTLLSQKDRVRMIFAAAPSQNEVLAHLTAYTDIDWSRIDGFHMDEYVGLPEALADRRFGTYLKEHIFGKVPFGSVQLIDATAADQEAECARYARLLAEKPVDIVVMGIGENGHIAFNDPPVADFQDPKLVKIVKLDEKCRNQQVHDGCFSALELVPTHAITLTCPALTAGAKMFCVVPGLTKAWAVQQTLEGEIGEHCPASVLRRCSGAALYLDRDSAKELTL